MSKVLIAGAAFFVIATLVMVLFPASPVGRLLFAMVDFVTAVGELSVAIQRFILRSFGVPV